MVKISRIRYEGEREKIAGELRINPSASVSDIADKLGFTRQKVYKIKRELKLLSRNRSPQLFSDETLRNFIILAKTGKKVSLIDKLSESKIDLIPSKRKLEQMGVKLEFSYLANGDSDVVLGFSSKDIVCAKMFCTLVKNHFSGFVISLEMIEILKQFDFHNASNLHNNESAVS
jgi:uncharacterized protein with GYD domain